MRRTVLRRCAQKIKKALIKMTLFLLGSLEVREDYKGELSSIVILAQEKLGDAILLTPLLRALRESLPGLEIHVITNSPIYDFFLDDPYLDAVHKGKNHYVSFYRTVLKRKFDVLFCTKDHPSFTFLYQSRLIRAGHRVGIQHPDHRGFFNYLVPIDFNQHVIEKNCALLDHLGVAFSKKSCRPYLPGGNITREVAELASHMGNRGIIGINLSAGDKDREWSVDKWRELIARLEEEIVILSMPDRTHDKAHLERNCDRVIASPQTRSIADAGEIIKRLALLITPDTSLVHVASCFDVDVVGLYSADLIQLERFYPYAVNYRKCVSATRLIEDIPVAEVADAVADILREKRNTNVS